LLLIHYLVREDQDSETIQIPDEIRKGLDRLSNVVTLSPTQSEEFAQAADLTMLVLKARPFPTKNSLVAVVAGCTALVMNGYVMHVDWNEIERVVTLLENGTWSKNKLVEWFERTAA
jgi:prophage maintenance system killer protein